MKTADWDAIGQDGRDYVRQRREEWKASQQQDAKKRKAAEISTDRDKNDDEMDVDGDNDEQGAIVPYDPQKGAKRGNNFGRNSYKGGKVD